MKKTIFTVVALAVAFVSSASWAVSVRGYLRGNGTYVQPHMRSYPDGNPYNNLGDLSKLETDLFKSPLNPVSFSPSEIG